MVLAVKSSRRLGGWLPRRFTGALNPSEIDEARFSNELATANLPEPDVMIRTSGEKRLSNFLLWQAAYAELIFVDALWPDFDETAFNVALEGICGQAAAIRRPMRELATRTAVGIILILIALALGAVRRERCSPCSSPLIATHPCT